ncbi:MAG: hypothetical protein ACRD6R_04820 [Candidatus Polarisedimenticolia bacterium]
MPKTRFINLFIEENPGCPEGCDLRFAAAGEPRRVTWVRPEEGAAAVCGVSGWSSAGGGSPCPAFAVPVEDSGAGVSILIYGGDRGLRLTPPGGAPYGEPYLLLSDPELAGDETTLPRPVQKG